MKYPIITIAREHGSGGRRIGKKLAEELNIAYYDKALIQLAAKESGLSEQIIADVEQQATNSLLFRLSVGSYDMQGYTPTSLPVADQVYLAQFQAIREMAEKGPCVIVGRCADYVLRERTDALHIFLHAPLEKRRERLVREFGLPEEKSAETIRKADKGRANFYNHYTGQKWGDSRLYQITMDTSMGEEQVLALLRLAAEG